MKKFLPTPPQDKLLDLFQYEEGVLYRNIATCPTVKEGDIAGTKSKRGYWDIRVEGKLYRRSRIVYAMHHGKCPTHLQIDHVNRNKEDDRIQNLRLVTNQENCRNKGIKSTNKSGVTGVYWSKATKKWAASIVADTKERRIGYFDTIEKATEARKKAEKRYGYHSNHGVTI